MEIKKIYQVYFSPTGGTKKAAQILTSAMNLETEEMDITDYGEGEEGRRFGPDDMVLFAIPVYGGRVPDTAMEKIRKMSGNNTPVVLMAVFGNRDYDDALLELKNEAASKGFVPAAAIAAVAEHSVMRQFGAGRPDDSDEEQLISYAGKILDRLDSVSSAGWIPEFKVKGNLQYKEYHGIPLKPKAGKECKKCGLCSVKCPVRAIPFEAPDKTDHDKCISCMRCISLCPTKARALNKLMLTASSAALSKACKERKENELFVF